MTALRWYDEVPADVAAAVVAVIEEAGSVDEVAPVGEQVLRELRSDRTKHLVATDGDAVVGYLNLAPSSESSTGMAELVVAPSARRRGTGAAMATAGLDAGGSGTRIWAHGNIAAAQATARSLGLQPVRELLQMRRSLADLPAMPSAAGMTIRTYAGSEDDAELVRVNNAAFSWHPEQGGWTDADVAQRRGESWFDADGLFLAYDDHTHALLGFHWTKVQPPGSATAGLGEVYVVGVDPAAQGRGLGRTLTLVGLHHLARQSSTVLLYVEADNTAAVNTYTKLGFTVYLTDVAYARRESTV